MELLYFHIDDELPLHKLELKERAFVMLLRNIDVNSGLCNGTTMILILISITSKILSIDHSWPILIVFDEF